MASNKKKRSRLWMKNPRCHWCNQKTLLEIQSKGQEHKLATIDHLYPRGHPRRTTYGNGGPVVLSCYQCNQRRNDQERAKPWKGPPRRWCESIEGKRDPGAFDPDEHLEPGHATRVVASRDAPRASAKS